MYVNFKFLLLINLGMWAFSSEGSVIARVGPALVVYNGGIPEEITVVEWKIPECNSRCQTLVKGLGLVFFWGGKVKKKRKKGD